MLKRTDIIFFLRQFATLINAGIPIIQACETLETCQSRQRARLLIYAIKRDLQAGHTLFQALQRHPRYFDSITCHLINLGEQTGKLAPLLGQIAAYQETRLEQNRRLKQALLYPSLVLITALGTTLILLLFVIPRFAELFQSTHTPLPPLTRFIFSLANLTQHGAWLFLLLIFPLLLPLRKKILSRLPFYRKVHLARFSRALSLTLAEGLPLHAALPFAADAAGTPAAHPIYQLKDRLHSGLQLHQAMQAFPAFPALMIQMVKTGEESGKLPAMLAKTAAFLEAEIEQTLGRASALCEPLIILILGVVIGGLVISMYLPVFKLGSTV